MGEIGPFRDGPGRRQGPLVDGLEDAGVFHVRPAGEGEDVGGGDGAVFDPLVSVGHLEAVTGIDDGSPELDAGTLCPSLLDIGECPSVEQGPVRVAVDDRLDADSVSGLVRRDRPWVCEITPIGIQSV